MQRVPSSVSVHSSRCRSITRAQPPAWARAVSIAITTHALLTKARVGVHFSDTLLKNLDKALQVGCSSLPRAAAVLLPESY